MRPARARTLDKSNLESVFDLTGQVTLVTGAGRGTGRAIAGALAARGAHVIVNDVDHLTARQAVASILEQGATASESAFDVTDYEAVADAATEIRRTYGRIDVVVNNAGNGGKDRPLSDRKPFWDTTPDEWHHWLGVNLLGVMNTTHAALRGMIENRYGRIVVIGSDAGRTGAPDLAEYSAAKAGAAGFVRSIARAAGRYGVNANYIALGGMDTPGARAFFVDDEVIDKSLKNYVIRRLGTPDEAAMMVLYLVSAAGRWITGQTYPLNGGFSFAL